MVMNTKYLCFSDIFVCSFVCIPTLLKKPSVSKYLTTLAFRRIIKKIPLILWMIVSSEKEKTLTDIV